MKRKLRLISGRKLNSPKGLETRPTPSIVREAVINILQDKLTNSHWLDLCSGSGVMTCEAIQKGVRRVLAIESNKSTAQICKSNLTSTASELNSRAYIEVICSEVIQLLKKGCSKQSFAFKKEFPNYDNRFDFIYLDPPYQSGLYSSILKNLIRGNWLKKEAMVICEFSKSTAPEISSDWLKIDEKRYGSIGLFFLTPNPASNYHDDTDSMRQQKDQE